MNRPDPERVAAVAARAHAAIVEGRPGGRQHRAVRQAAVRSLFYEFGWSLPVIEARTGIPGLRVRDAIGRLVNGVEGVTHRSAENNVTTLPLRRPRPDGPFQKPIKRKTTYWQDPTADSAIGVPEWKWLRVIAMVEYLADVYGTEGIARSDDGRIVATLERPINHGTRGGYLAHIRRRIPPCRPCSDANTADFLRRRAARKKAS